MLLAEHSRVRCLSTLTKSDRTPFLTRSPGQPVERSGLRVRLQNTEMARWRSFQESAEMLLEGPLPGLKLLQEGEQLINPAIGRGKGHGIQLKIIRLPQSLAQEWDMSEDTRECAVTVGETTGPSKNIVVTEQPRIPGEGPARSPRSSRGRGRSKNIGNSPTHRPAGLARFSEQKSFNQPQPEDSGVAMVSCHCVTMPMYMCFEHSAHT